MRRPLYRRSDERQQRGGRGIRHGHSIQTGTARRDQQNDRAVVHDEVLRQQRRIYY